MAGAPTPPHGDAPEFDAVILAGGQATRLGGVDKPGLVVGSGTMVAAVTGAAVAAGARQVILVGPARPGLAGLCAPLAGGLTVVREDPPGAGPIPALRAGMAAARAAWVVLLAADLPFLRREQLRALLAIAAAGRRAGAVLADASGAAQWLAGCWQAAALRSALLEYRGSSLRGLLGPLCPVAISPATPAGEPPPWLDCDTPAELAAAQLAAAQRAAARRAGPSGPGQDSRATRQEADSDIA